MASWAINERFNIERQVAIAICKEIVSGGRSPHDTVPPPHVLAKQKILNPRVVEAAYATLVNDGLMTVTSDGDYRVTDDAQERARESLLKWAEEEAQKLASALRQVGLRSEDVQRILAKVIDV